VFCLSLRKHLRFVSIEPFPRRFAFSAFKRLMANEDSSVCLHFVLSTEAVIEETGIRICHELQFDPPGALNSPVSPKCAVLVSSSRAFCGVIVRPVSAVGEGVGTPNADSHLINNRPQLKLTIFCRNASSS
jgi:hypothetical protein